MLLQYYEPRAPASSLPAISRAPSTREPSPSHAHQHTPASSLKPPRPPAHGLPEAATHAYQHTQISLTHTSTREPSPSSCHAHQRTRAFSLKPPRAPAHTFSSLPFSPRTPQEAPLFLLSNSNFNYTVCAMTHALLYYSTLPTLTDTCATHNERASLIPLQLPANSLLIFSRLC